MQITTKFNLGQTVYPIRSCPKQVVTTCSTCGGSGRVTIVNKGYKCPECYGTGTKTHTEPQKWQVVDTAISKIGSVSVELYTKYHQKINENQIRYMLEATGVGGGTLWNEDDLFATLEEAQAECDRRNNQ